MNAKQKLDFLLEVFKEFEITSIDMSEIGKHGLAADYLRSKGIKVNA